MENNVLLYIQNKMIGDGEMFICKECGNVFEEPIRWEERHGLDTPPFEQHIGCPYCQGAYVEAYRCDCCDYWIDGTYIKTSDGKRFCEECCVKMELGDE